MVPMHCSMSEHPVTWQSRVSGDDRGFLMVEVLVSSMILIIVSLAAFLALDQNDKLAGNNQKRSIAGNMAQAEIERIRSLPIEDVANLNGTKTVIGPNGPADQYFITTKTKWVTDGADIPDCATRSGGLDYMRLSVTTGWRKMDNAKPITMTTIVTPSSRSSSSTAGSLSVNVTKADNSGAQGLPIAINGNQDFTETTNINGCVVFPFVPAGDYMLSFSRPGWVDGDNVSAINQLVKVAAGQTNKLGFNYDQGGYTKMAFKTGRNAFGDVDSSPDVVSLLNGVQTMKPFKVDIPTGAKSWDGSGTPLFPSLSPYVLYPGSCPSAPPTGTTNVNISSGAMQNAGTVRVPSLDVKVWSGTPGSPGSVVNNAKVVVTSGCGADIVRYTASDGRLADPGFPYAASASVCVSAGGRLFAATTPITDYTSNPPLKQYYLGVGSGSNSGTCAG